MPTGKMGRWNGRKWYSFIKPDDGASQIYVNAGNLIGGPEAFGEGDQVTFFIEYNERQGKLEATWVDHVNPSTRELPVCGNPACGYRINPDPRRRVPDATVGCWNIPRHLRGLMYCCKRCGAAHVRGDEFCYMWFEHGRFCVAQR